MMADHSSLVVSTLVSTVASGQSENTPLEASLAQRVSFYCLGLCADSQPGTARICLGAHQWTDRQEHKVCKHDRVLFSHKEECNYVTCKV